MDIEETTDLEARLVKFGLSETEAKIYVHLLSNGKEMGGSNIALATKLHRQYVYNALPHLIELGLVEEVPKGKQNKYKARPPIIFEKLGLKKALFANDLARDLDEISSIGNEQDFEVIQGKKAMLQFEMDFINHTEGNYEELIIGSASGGFLDIMGDNLEEYLSRKEKKNIVVKYIGSEREIAEFDSATGPYENQNHRVLKQMPEGTANMVIRPHEVCFYSFAHPPHVYVVKSKAVADHYKKFFEMLWDMSEEVK